MAIVTNAPMDTIVTNVTRFIWPLVFSQGRYLRTVTVGYKPDKSDKRADEYNSDKRDTFYKALGLFSQALSKDNDIMLQK